MTTHRLPFLNGLNRPALIAVIHVRALPGTPRSQHNVADIARIAASEAAIFADAGVDAIILENMHDLPYLNRRVGPEIVASMTAICAAVRANVTLPLGIQILAGANRAAIATAHATGCQFVRCEGFVFGHVADEGLINADAGRLLRYRKRIGADDIAIIADVKKKHAAHAITSDVDLAATAQAAAWCDADGVIVTGTTTGRATDPAEVSAVRAAVDVPVLVGSGITPENVHEVAPHAHGLIVGSYLKRDGLWSNEVDAQRVAIMAKSIRDSKN